MMPRIPETLWKEKVLHLPKAVADFYEMHVNGLGRLADAIGPPPKNSPIGGSSVAETEDHLVYRFPNSCARSVYVTLDPDTKVSAASELLASALVEGEVWVLDVPCGAGEGTAGILSTLAEMRRHNAVTLPLRVHVVGADYSPRALQLFSASLSHIAASCEQSCIRVTHEVVLWNVLDRDAHEGLCSRLPSHAKEALLVVSNFSGAMRDAAIEKAVRSFFDYVCVRFSQRTYSAVWFEPGWKHERTVRGLFEQAATAFGFARFLLGETSEYRLRHPCSGSEFESKVSVWACKRDFP